MITSKQNALIKQIRSLKDKKFRDELNFYIVEGIKMTKEAFTSGQQVVSVICTLKKEKEVLSFCPFAQTVKDEIMDYVSSEVSPQGVIAVVKKPTNELVSPIGYSLLLDGVSDPANVGAIIRTAAASGFNDVYLVDSADAYSPKAVRASMSGIFKVKTHAFSREQILSVINTPIVVADMNGVNAKEFKSKSPLCLVIGNEARGVSNELKNKATYTISLDMDNEMESLNASVSASILMYSIKGKI